MEPWLIPIVEAIAKKHGTSPAEVYRDMQAAVDAAHQAQTPAAQSLWDALPFPDSPRPEDLIRFCTASLAEAVSERPEEALDAEPPDILTAAPFPEEGFPVIRAAQ